MGIRKRWFTDAGQLEIDYSSTMQQNEYRINRISGLLALATLAGSLVMLLLNLTGVFILDNTKSVLIVLFLAPFALFSFFISVIFRVEKPWVKYAMVVSECIVIFMLYAFLSVHVVLLMALPVVKSCLYFDRKIYRLTAILSSMLMLLSHFASVYLTIVPDDSLAENIYSAVIYGFIPRFIEYALICLTAGLLTKTSSAMIFGGYRYARKNTKLIQDMRETNYEIVKNLATISENKSRETGEHNGRVFEYMKVLATGFGYPEEQVYNVSLAAMLHDIGKLCVDESILSKPAKLTDDEFAQVKKHTNYGRNLLSNSKNEVMRTASVIAEQHHERWDGNGYGGLKGEQIDRLSRMMSVVDVFDALTSKRCYKRAWAKEEAYEEILRGRGTQFDPDVVDMFAKNFDRFSEICDRMNPDCPD